MNTDQHGVGWLGWASSSSSSSSHAAAQLRAWKAISMQRPNMACSHHVSARMDARTMRVDNGSRIKLAQGKSFSFSACVDNGSRIKLRRKPSQTPHLIGYHLTIRACFSSAFPLPLPRPFPAAQNWSATAPWSAAPACSAASAWSASLSPIASFPNFQFCGEIAYACSCACALACRACIVSFRRPPFCDSGFGSLNVLPR